MKPNINLDKVASGLGAERRGAIHARGGHFGALALAAEVGDRFRTPARGGRATDPAWTERRLLPLRQDTLSRLEALALQLHNRGVDASPLQVAALLLERAVTDADDDTLAELARGVG